MSGFTNAVEQALLDYFVATYAVPTKYIGLSSTLPTVEDGTGFTEPTIGAGGYQRVSTVTADWAAATGIAPATKANSAVKTYAQATADWLAGVDLVAFGIFDGDTAGAALLAFGELTVHKPVLLGDTPSFGAGALVLKLGDPTDPYGS